MSFLFFFGLLFIVDFCFTKDIYYIKGFGHSVSLCLNTNNSTIESSKAEFKCDRITSSNCVSSTGYRCKLNCNFTNREVVVNNQLFIFKQNMQPSLKLYVQNTFKLPKKSIDEYIEHNLTISYQDPNLLNVFLLDEINIILSSNITCINKTVKNNTIICNLNHLSSNFDKKVNVSIQIGKGCHPSENLGTVKILRNSKITKIWKRYYWILIILSFTILLSIVAYVLYYLSLNKKDLIKERKKFEKKIVEHQMKFTKCQRKAFLEYQIAVDSFNNLGKLTPRHVLSFYDYLTRTFKVDLKTNVVVKSYDELEFFELKLLNKENLITWITNVESKCRIEDRMLVAAYLTIYFFQKPIYYLDVMKTLIVNLIFKLKANPERRLIFSESEYIIEMIVGFWIDLCMYEHLQSGIIAERFFNLYRAVKCKITSGIVDNFTNKAKYAMSNEHLLTSDYDYEEYIIIATINIELKMMDSSQAPLQINLEKLEVTVLSLDCISQVKAKILDKAILKYIELENFVDGEEEEINLTIDFMNDNEFFLYFSNNNVQILLQNFDSTSISSVIDSKVIIINTVKHYNIKKDTQLYLKSTSVSLPMDNKVLVLEKRLKVHLQVSNDFVKSYGTETNEKTKSKGQNLVYKPLLDNENKDSYLMILLATKKSIYPFINGFFQSILDWKPNDNRIMSSNSLFNTSVQYINESTSNYEMENNERYLMPVYYLFSMIDDISRNVNCTEEEVKLWKSFSFINQFWVNMIQNPNFIFSVDKTPAIESSLKTIAGVLKESCTIESLRNTNGQDTPFINKLFLEDINNYYSSWWDSFSSNSQRINEHEIVEKMSSIAEENHMNEYSASALNNLHIISRTLMLEEKVTGRKTMKLPSIFDSEIRS